MLSQRSIEGPNILFIDGLCFFLAVPRILKAFPDHWRAPLHCLKGINTDRWGRSPCHVQLFAVGIQKGARLPFSLSQRCHRPRRASAVSERATISLVARRASAVGVHARQDNPIEKFESSQPTELTMNDRLCSVLVQAADEIPAPLGCEV